MEFRKLKADEIECRIGTINAKGLSLLLYKDARVDMKILDETVGSMNWQRDHKELKGNIYCGISLWDDEKKQWITKWDCGTESYTEKEKGEASDSFKRAGFNVGIGRELYTSPFIWIRPEKDEIEEKDGKYTTKTTFKVYEIGYDKENRINKLTIVDNKGTIRFQTLPKEESDERITLLDKIQMLEIEKEIDMDKFNQWLEEKYGTQNTANIVNKDLKEIVEVLEKKGK